MKISLRWLFPLVVLALALCALTVAAQIRVEVGQPFVPGPPPLLAAKSDPPTLGGYTPDAPGKRYDGTKWTQEIFQYTGGARIIRPFPIRDMSDKRWHQPGGLLGVTGWTAEKFRYLPDGTELKHVRAGIAVKNSFGGVQVETGITRVYPVGTRFDEVLRNAETGVVFEHRVREKKTDGWKSTVYHRDETARPAGYTGLKVSCRSCHAEAGTGKYADGLVPGGDTVLSDPLDLNLANESYDLRLIRR